MLTRSKYRGKIAVSMEQQGMKGDQGRGTARTGLVGLVEKYSGT